MESYEVLLKHLVLFAQIFGIPIAIYTLHRTRVEARISRDLNIGLQLLEVFRGRWEKNWRELLSGERSKIPDYEKEMKNF